MKITDITDILVSPMASNSVRIEWMAQGLRWHVNMLRDTGVVQTAQFGTHRDRKTLYKNPPRTVKMGDTGYFKTTMLDAEAASNAKIVQHVLKHVWDNNMVEDAYKAEAEAKAAKEDTRRSEILHKMRIILCDNGMPGQDLDIDQALDIMDRARQV